MPDPIMQEIINLREEFRAVLTEVRAERDMYKAELKNLRKRVIKALI